MHRRIARGLGAGLVAAGILVAVARLGHFPMGEAAEDGVLRLAWRMAGSQAELCSERTDEELAELLPHMRVRRACHQLAVPYRLRLSVSGQEVANGVHWPWGAKGDRPIYVQQDIRLIAGPHPLRLEFLPAEELWAAAEVLVLTPADRERLRVLLAERPEPRFEGTVRIEAGRIVLIDWDESARRFHVLQ